MNIIELAIEVGAEQYIPDFDRARGVAREDEYTFQSSVLTKFATAISNQAIEDYKASLVPVAYERKGMLFFEDDISDESLYTKLYNLGETK